MKNITNSDMNQFTYREWISYFEENHAQRLQIDFSQEKPLSEAERALIFPSVRAFQKGEGSDGAHLLKTVDAFLKNGGEPEYREAMVWFIREENRHSQYLKKYMDFYQEKALKRSFLDSAFRRLRKAMGLKCEVTVLVTAEMIALTYYDALANCTDSPVLKRICSQMLHDETPHIMFQSYTLSHFKNRLPDQLFRILVMKVTLLFVWGAFHRVYQAGGYDFRRFVRENQGYLWQSIDLSKQKR